jgi:hypothetical protein
VNTERALLEELSTIPAFQEKISAQPLEPRPGLHWLEHDRRRLIWVNDDEPVICHPKAVRDNDIQQIWVSTKSGQPMELMVQDKSREKIRRYLPCGEWAALEGLF